MGGWYEKVDDAGGFEDACGEDEVKRVKLSEGGGRDISMKVTLKSGLYQIKGGSRNDAIL